MEDFREIDRSTVYSNPWMTVHELRIERNGSPGIYGIVERPDAAAMVVRVAPEHILMVRQYRFPTGRYSLELPMGGIDIGESPEDAAARELQEETGISVELTFLGSFYPIPGLTPQEAHVFVTEVVSQEDLHLERFPQFVDEIVGYEVVAMRDLPRRTKVGDISDGFTLGALALYNFLGGGPR